MTESKSISSPPSNSVQFDLLKELSFQWLGEVSYSESVERQKCYVQPLLSEEGSSCLGARGIVLGCEHPPTITLGISAKSSDILGAVSSFDVIRSERGGRATLHSPGQLLIYPICNIRKIGVSRYAQALLTITQDALTKLGVKQLEARQGSGLFVEKAKLGFMGLKVQRGVVSHGLAINVCNDVSQFQTIVSCGVQAQAMTSLAELGIGLKPVELFSLWQDSWTHYWQKLSETPDLGVALGRPVFS